MRNFYDVCKEIKKNVTSSMSVGYNNITTIMKNAMLGCESETRFLKDKIRTQLMKTDSIEPSSIPSWYKNMDVVDAVYAETFGWGVVAEWFTDDYKDSPCFYIINDNCFIERDGHQKLMKQRATIEFLNRMVKTLELTNNDSVTIGDTTLLAEDVNEFVFSRPTPSLVTKQDITLELWSKFTDAKIGIPLDIDCIESCAMRKINSFGIKLKDGREFKVIVKDLREDD